MNNNIKVTCWGSRGSGPAPYTEQMEYGGNTSCFTIETGQMLLVLDGGTGLVALGREMMKNPDDKRDIHIFISHLHLDHIIGIPLFKPLFQTGRRICFYGESRNGRSLKQQLNLFIGPPYWPVSLSQCSASIEYYEVEAGKILSLPLPQSVQILPIRSNHPDQTVLYRIQLEETMVFYGLDCELNQEMTDVLSNYAENAGLLICDVQYSPEDYIFHKGWGHSTWEAALKLAEASSAKRIWLTHFDWEADSSTLFCLERQATLCNPNCEYVREGMTVWL